MLDWGFNNHDIYVYGDERNLESRTQKILLKISVVYI